MNFVTYATVFASFILTGFAHEHYPSLASKVLATYSVPEVKDRSAAAKAKAANHFLALLSDSERSMAHFGMESKERQEWTNLPSWGKQKGARLGDLNEKQIQAAMVLLATVLSEEGYHRAWSIPLADDELLEDGKRKVGYGAEDFYLVIFGEPAEDKPWALQFDGHHLALNITMHGDKVSMSPSFIGTQPHVFSVEDKEVRPIQGYADKAHRLINALPKELQKKAIVGKKRGKIRTAAGKDGVVPKLRGVKVALFDLEQKKMLLELVHDYVNTLPKHNAASRMEELNKEIDQMYFSWRGPTPVGSDVSYMIQGPSLIIEYACQSLGGNPIDHVHSMYRDPTNEYGVKWEK